MQNRGKLYYICGSELICCVVNSTRFDMYESGSVCCMCKFGLYGLIGFISLIAHPEIYWINFFLGWEYLCNFEIIGELQELEFHVLGYDLEKKWIIVTSSQSQCDDTKYF